jgi:hypothetical protein
MSFPHCPLCVALAVMTVFRAASHLLLLGLRLPAAPGLKMAASGILRPQSRDALVS